MTRRTPAVVLLTALSASAQETAKPEARGPRYTMATAGASVILLDTMTGESWVLQKPKGPGKAAWVPIERKAAGPRAGAAREVPLVQEIDVSALQPAYGPRGGPKGEEP